MKIFIVANLDKDWGIDIFAAHKTKLQAEITKDNLPDKIDRDYSKVYELEVQE